jgi:MFS transporter, DHA1 family, multidrug resistance protein
MAKWLPFSRDDLRDPGQRNVLFIALSQGVSAVSFTFVDTLTPFYIFKVSPYPQKETLFWVGAIMGAIGLFLMVTAPVWGAMTHRFVPKRLFQRAQMANGLVFLAMGFTMDLRVLLGLKMLQGIFGGVSTIGLILVSSSSSKERLGANVGLFQSCLTLGQLAGPPLGTLFAATFGYRGAFICGFLIVCAATLLCQFKVADVPKLPRPPKPAVKEPFDKRVLAGWAVCVMAQIQLIFLPSILPKVLETFNLYGAFALKIAGVVVMFYTAAAAFGSFSLTRITKKIGIVRLITILLVLSAIFQALLSFPQGVVGFTFVRMLQTGFAAAVIPLVFSIFAVQKRGAVIGFINSSRFGGSASGPMLAASVLAVSNLHTLFLVISGLTILALIGFRLIFKSD